MRGTPYENLRPTTCDLRLGRWGLGLWGARVTLVSLVTLVTYDNDQ